jgi:hypothetical protein
LLAILFPVLAAIAIGVMLYLLWRLARRLLTAAKGRKGETPPVPPVAPS